MIKEYVHRSAGIDDIEQLKQLGIISYGQYAPSLTADNLEKMRTNFGKTEMWAELLSIAHGFVCVHDDAIVGMAFIVPNGNPWDIFSGDEAYIRLVGVHPQHQGRGIARELTGKCIAYAQATGETGILLHTSEVMHAARHLYESLGFTIVQEIAPRLGMRYWMYRLDIARQV